MWRKWMDYMRERIFDANSGGVTPPGRDCNCMQLYIPAVLNHSRAMMGSQTRHLMVSSVTFYLVRKCVVSGAQLSPLQPPPPPNCGNTSQWPTKIRPHFGEEFPRLVCGVLQSLRLFTACVLTFLFLVGLPQHMGCLRSILRATLGQEKFPLTVSFSPSDATARIQSVTNFYIVLPYLSIT